jgi:hypothetical protein
MAAHCAKPRALQRAASGESPDSDKWRLSPLRCAVILPRWEVQKLRIAVSARAAPGGAGRTELFSTAAEALRCHHAQQAAIAGGA